MQSHQSPRLSRRHIGDRFCCRVARQIAAVIIDGIPQSRRICNTWPLPEAYRCHAPSVATLSVPNTHSMNRVGSHHTRLDVISHMAVKHPTAGVVRSHIGSDHASRQQFDNVCSM
jgi:hypothetical protein